MPEGQMDGANNNIPQYISTSVGIMKHVSNCVQWGSAECSSHSTCFDFPADHITCLLVEWFALAGTIVWVAVGWLFGADYAVLPCET